MAKTDTGEIKKIFDRALSALGSGDFSSARAGFEEVLRINPKSSEAYLNLGNVYFYQHDHNNAIANFKKAIDNDPTLAKAYINAGSSHFAQGDFENAIGYWNVASHIAPDNPVVHQNIAVAYEKVQNPQKAFKHYELYLKFNKKNDKTTMKISRKVSESKKIAYHNMNVGIEYQKRKQFAQAAMAFKKTINIYPNFAKAHINLGSIFYQNNKIENAIECWEDGLKLEPNHANTHCNLAIAYDKTKIYDEACFHYKKYLELTQGKTKDAKEVKKRADEIDEHLTNHKELVKQHLNKGNEFIKKQFYEEAIYEFEKYLMLSPNSTDANMIKKKIEECKTRLNPVEKALEIALEMGDEYFQGALFDKALAAYNRYLALNAKGPKAAEVKKKIDLCHKHISSVVSAMLNNG